MPRVTSRTGSPARGRDRDVDSAYDSPAPRASYARSVTSDSVPTSRDYSPVGHARLSRVPTEPSALLARTALRPGRPRDADDDYSDRADSSVGGLSSRTASWGLDGPPSQSQNQKKAPPPPPPSRAKKPPPAPPLKRSALSSSEVSSHWQR